MDGLIIRKEPLDLIFSGKKKCEFRGRKTARREKTVI
jgi:ASC-1-like (ASCH) protein